jgi:hypothetical protein
VSSLSWTLRAKAGTRAIEVERVRRSRSLSWLLGASAFATVALGTAPASAFGNQWHAGAKGGFAFQNDRDLGWGAGVHGAYGLSDMFDLELELFIARNGAPLEQKSQVTAATAGIAYKVDVFRWIPYVGLLGGYYHWGGVPGPHGETQAGGGAVQIGLDYLLMREVALSLDFRAHFSFKEEFYFPMRTLMLGAEYRWEM